MRITLNPAALMSLSVWLTKSHLFSIAFDCCGDTAHTAATVQHRVLREVQGVVPTYKFKQQGWTTCCCCAMTWPGQMCNLPAVTDQVFCCCFNAQQQLCSSTSVLLHVKNM
jgi:hypothetical protein